MKKILFLITITSLSLTACTSHDVQSPSSGSLTNDSLSSSYSSESITSEISSSLEQQNPLHDSSASIYKNVNLYGWDDVAQIPLIWNSYANGDVQIPSTIKDIPPTIYSNGYSPFILVSVAPKTVFFGTDASEQVDVFLIPRAVQKEMIADRKNQSNQSVTWTKDKLFGKTADVMTTTVLYNEKPRVSQDTKIYFVSWNTESHDMGLVVRKQLSGDVAYENAIKQFLQSFNMQTFITQYKDLYPSV